MSLISKVAGGQTEFSSLFVNRGTVELQARSDAWGTSVRRRMTIRQL